MATSTQQPLEESIVRENHRSSPHQPSNYLHQKNVKKGVERLERHPSSGFNPSPKKSGKGGRFTWEGPHEFSDGFITPLDKNDPNYVDDEPEESQEKIIKNKPGEESSPAPAPASTVAHQ